MADTGFSQTSDAERQFGEAPHGTRSLWPWALVLAAVALLIVARGLWAPTGDGRSGRDHPAIGAQLAELSLAPLTGDARALTAANLPGKVTLINFWGPWCGYCVQEFPHLVELEQHFRRQADFQFLSVSSNPDPLDTRGLADETDAFLQQQRASFPTYVDPQGRTRRALAEAARLDSFGYPTTVVLDRDSRIRGLWVGYLTGDERQMRIVIEEALRGESAPPQ